MCLHHVGGNEDSRHPCRHRERGGRAQEPEIKVRREEKKEKSDGKSGEDKDEY